MSNNAKAVRDFIDFIRLEVASLPRREREDAQLSLNLSEPMMLYLALAHEREDDPAEAVLAVSGALTNALLSFAGSITKGDPEGTQGVVEVMLTSIGESARQARSKPPIFSKQVSIPRERS